ncbi:hypothetical protein TeGR_g11875 [Tetraparma gracilis]|uniref:Uncharacterized protein n=1 Tax=Tetraparma gracilis TaxID=2962635 RepID=A0ABQ6N3S2_9STRA|nr:hypothetical protein TeGR_g11875 [Tetraparma gracilis]
MGQKLAALGGRSAPSNLACVCLDLDGTLLCSDHRCHPTSVATLRKLHSRGIQVMLCTGRSPSSLVEVLADLDLPDVPVVCMNGTAGFVFRTPPPLSALASHPMSFSVTLTPALIASVAAATGDDNLPLQLYSADGTIYCSANPDNAAEVAIMKRYETLTGTKQKVVDLPSLLSLAETTQFQKMLVLTGDDRVTLVHDLLAGSVQPQHQCTLIKGSPSWFVEVLPAGANKGEGLRRMCAKLDLDVGQCVAMGDGNNDVEFVAVAGWGVSMKNGTAEVKAAANEVCAFTNDELGVSKFLEDFMERGLQTATVNSFLKK